MGELTQQMLPLLDFEIHWSILIPHGNKPRSQLGQTVVSLGKVVAAFCIILLVVIGVSTFISGSNEKTTLTTSSSFGQQYTSDYNSDWKDGTRYTYPTYTPFTLTPTPTRPPDMKLSLGQTATVDSRKITVYSAKKSESYNLDKMLVIFDVEITNTGNQDGMNGEWYTRDSENHSGTYLGSYGELQYVFLNGGERKRGEARFEFPSSAKDIKFYYRASPSDTTQLVSYTVPN
jgi:hypothetical protein